MGRTGRHASAAAPVMSVMPFTPAAMRPPFPPPVPRQRRWRRLSYSVAQLDQQPHLQTSSLSNILQHIKLLQPAPRSSAAAPAYPASG